MNSTVYVIRSSEQSEQSTARSVCLKGGTGVVLSLGNTFPPGKVEKAIELSPVQQDEKLSYDQILALLLKADKVITL
jgi:hypothetical protein